MPGLPQSASQPGFATFLANIGQTPASGTGEDGGFGQLLATHPGAATIGKTGTAGAAPTGKTGTPGAAPTGDTQATTASVIALAGPKAAGTVAPTADAVPTTAITPDETPHVVTPDFAAIVGGKKLATEAKAAPAADTEAAPATPADDTSPKAAPKRAGPDVPQPDAQDAAAHAASLLAALTGKPAKPAADPAKTGTGRADAEATDAAPTADAAATAGTTPPAVPLPVNPLPAAANAVAPEASAPVADKPAKAAKPALAPAAPQGRDAPAAPAVTPAKAESATATPAPAAEPAAKPIRAEGGASMTVLFNQPAAPSATSIGAPAQAAPLAERTLDLTSDDRWIAQLAADIAATKSDKGDLSFRLMPRHLGRLDVAMKLDGDSVSMKLDTQHESTAAIVAAAQPRLVEDLRQQGVRVAGAEVTCTPDQAGRPSLAQGQGQGQNQGRGAAPDASHLIETANDRADARDDDSAANRRGRFA
ncbi:flagellar hook-length control protein FliK [uncultured Sphingopyxis sp.]|uniref:flagellar hook-length control protein FliK n=1 Tax=uncultured Sphingopyxis sp. TaxID=310581 RepID=UPI0025982804|nr:flagellar hook-length control protein FliK [uncultured Sphingopyxis sp.]